MANSGMSEAIEGQGGNLANPFAPFFLGLEAMRIACDAQAVIAMRTAGMMGLWSIRPSEMSRMVREKPEAAADAWLAVIRAVLGGMPIDGVAHAAMQPYGRRTGANARRLARLGPPSLCG